MGIVVSRGGVGESLRNAKPCYHAGSLQSCHRHVCFSLPFDSLQSLVNIEKAPTRGAFFALVEHSNLNTNHFVFLGGFGITIALNYLKC